MTSVLNSTRKISKVFIDYNRPDETTLQTMISIVKKFSASIKYLRIKVEMAMSELLEILSLVPKVEELALDLQLPVEDTLSLQEMSSNGDLNLHRLKKLYFSSYSTEFLAVFSRLPVGVLRELELQYVDLFRAAIFLFKRQTNIKKLKLKSYRVDDDVTMISDIFDNLKLESLELYHGSNFIIATVLSKQAKLKSLTLKDVAVDRKIMNFVGNQLTELETFSVDISVTPTLN